MGTHDWTLGAGPATIWVYGQEDGTMLDALFLTDNLSELVEGVSPREPTSADISIQTGGAAVEATGKFAILWADLRR